MKDIKIFMFFLLVNIVLFPAFSLAQAPDTTAANDNQIIELGAKEIKVAIEAPQVKLLTSRIKPEFDDIHLDKSFIKEIVGEGEKFSFRTTERAQMPEEINIDRMINKKR